MYEMHIKADTNDADYVTSINNITDEQLAVIQPVIDAIKIFNKKSWKERGNARNWNRTESNWMTPLEEVYPQLMPEQIEIFDEYIPYGENGIHTIKSITLYPDPVKIELL